MGTSTWPDFATLRAEARRDAPANRDAAAERTGDAGQERSEHADGAKPEQPAVVTGPDRDSGVADPAEDGGGTPEPTQPKGPRGAKGAGKPDGK